jgi:hypothetical protein
MNTDFAADAFDDAIADYIYLDVDTDPLPTPEECRELIDEKLCELKLLPDKLSALPFDFCNGSLLEAAIEDAINKVNWDAVVEKIKFFRMENN